MLKTFFQVTLRNLLRQWSYSFINKLGLTIGLTISILIILYIVNELSYDRHYMDVENIYRVALSGQMAGQPFETVVTLAPLAFTMVENFPEVNNATRVFGST